MLDSFYGLAVKTGCIAFQKFFVFLRTGCQDGEYSFVEVFCLFLGFFLSEIFFLFFRLDIFFKIRLKNLMIHDVLHHVPLDFMTDFMTGKLTGGVASPS